MHGIYGKKWSDQFPTDSLREMALREWGIGLAGLSGEQIKRGIDKCRTDCKWPPSIAEFVQYAKGKDESWEHKGAAYRFFPKALPKPKPDPQMVKGNLKAMRLALAV